MVLIIDFISWIFSIILKFFKGINYIFMKRPTISKYLSLTLLFLVGLAVMVLKASEWGIIALIVGLSMPVAYVSFFSSKLDEVRKDIENIKNIASNTNLEIVFDKEETKLFENELMKDKKFRKDLENNFLDNQQRLRKKSKKNIQKQIENNQGSDLIIVENEGWKYNDNGLLGGFKND